jgi:opacity protein-like surface antigen
MGYCSGQGPGSDCEDTMKSSFFALLLFLVLLAQFTAFPASAPALSMYDDEESEINLAFGIKGWLTTASAKWQISFPFTQAGQTGKIESELDFNKIDSPMVIVTGGARITPLFSFDLVYGTGSISGGQGSDTDRFVPDQGGVLEFSNSTSDVSGDVKMWGGNVYFNNRRFGNTKAGPWGAVIGYLHYEDNLTITNGVQTVSVPFAGSSFPPLGPFPGLNSTYDFSWDALKLGVTNQASITKELMFDGMLSFFPLVRYTSEGFWNLRAGNGPNDFRRQFPNFTQQSTTGYGYEAALGLSYELSENTLLSAGYRYFYLYATNGTDTVYFANGATSESTLDWVTVTRRGAYAEFLLKF